MIWVTRFIHYLGYITKYGLGFNEFFEIILSVLPSLLVLIIPICTFISTIIYYSKINKNNELIILQNSGLRKKDLLIPSFSIGLISCFVLYFIMFYILPRGNILFSKLYDSMRHNAIKFLLNSDDFRIFKNITVHSNCHDGGKLNSLVIYIDDKSNKKTKIIYAKNAEIIEEKYLKLCDGSIHFMKFDDQNGANMIFFKDYILDINEFLPIEKQKKYNDIEFLNIKDILKIKNKDNYLIVEIVYRITNPLFVIVLALFSSLLVLKINFTRSDSNLKSFFIFLVNLFLFAIFSYLFKLSKLNLLFMYLMLLVILVPSIYILISILEK